MAARFYSGPAPPERARPEGGPIPEDGPSQEKPPG